MDNTKVLQVLDEEDGDLFDPKTTQITVTRQLEVQNRGKANKRQQGTTANSCENAAFLPPPTG